MNLGETLEGLVENNLDFDGGRDFVAILGRNPSQGARSPILWNAVFKAANLETEMLPLDIAPEDLVAVLKILQQNPRFLGGAVAAPYKEEIANWLGRAGLSEEALRIGAVNCLYRDASGRLMGTNTDGEGALKSLESAFGSISGASVLLIGCGGAGKAVATYLAAAVGSTGRLQISNRNRTAATQFVEALGVEDAAWPVLSAEIEAADIVVNCTSIGAGELRDYTPLAAVDVLSASANQDICRTSLDGARPDCLIFDIIYDPAETKMLQTAKNRGLRCLNGKAMNFEQAVLGFRYATPQAGSLEFVTSVMNAAL